MDHPHAYLVGHASQAAAEAVHRKLLRPVITEGAGAVDDIVARRCEATAPEA
ncbi:hypothetical protein ACFC4G_13320 [Streptomyces sp. NPDC056002]|uniref:hypothetical protein n=1 Tax=Streptomyces sp. NPDC056002 TaxID=3345675 RepID=UPI0035DB5007